MMQEDVLLDPNEDQDEDSEDEGDRRLQLARRVIQNLKQQVEALESLLEERQEPTVDVEQWLEEQIASGANLIVPPNQGRVLEGVFDGEGMVGEDGRRYSVPPNYASKSKLVEGDLLRLTIADTGRFVFKQKGPIERQRVVGMLVQDEQTQDWKVMANGTPYRVLAASVSYFNGSAGDEAVILVPRNTPSRWAAVENIIQREGGED